ncbi:threonine dehydratase mitochondrial-related [Holotrichia oblita]|nr:threonine dehydratase mitochondrial-related [Holotrichia oblita]
MFDAVILAGGRTNSLLSRHSEEKYEAMIEIQNKPMVSYVAEALRQSSQIRRIYVAGPAKQLAGCPLPSSTKVVEGGASVIDTANLAFAALSQENITENKKVKEKILIATSDIPLLTAESIDDFLEKSLKTEADVYYPVISKKTYENLLPESRRTYVRLKEGLFTGGNIFLANPQVLSGCAKIAESIIAKRKNPFKLCAASAGNHAQGVAYAALLAGIKATIVMPRNAPLAKIVATKGYGAEVILAGGVYDEAFEKAEEIHKEQGQTFIHAFNDETVIAGQGTVGLEIMQDLADIEAIVVPVGGGGLLAGILMAVKETSPHIKVYGVQSQGAKAMYVSKKAQAICREEAKTFADGIAVKMPGDITFPIIEKYADDIVTVDDEHIANTILMLLERSKLMVEGAGAVGLAAVLDNKIPHTPKGRIVSIISGGNVDVNFIATIIERGLVKAGRRVRLLTDMSDKPGSLKNLLAIVAELQANVLAISHDRAGSRVLLGQALVELSLETRDALHTEQIIVVLKKEGYNVEVVG